MRSVPPAKLHSTRRVALGTLAAALLSCWSVHVTAQQTEHFALTWESPSTCPQQLEVDEQVHVLLGASPNSVLQSHLRAKGLIEPIGKRFQLTLAVEFGKTRGSRIIVADECRSLGKAAALVLGLLIRKEQELGRELSNTELGGDFQTPNVPIESGANQSVEQPRQTTIAAPKEGRVAHNATADERSDRRWFVLLQGPTATVDFWTLPNLNLGFGLAAGLLRQPWRLYASTTFWLSQEQTTPGVEGYRATFKRQSFEIWGCRDWRWGNFEVGPCIVTAVDSINATASGGRLTSKDKNVWILSLGAGFTGHLHLASWLSLFLSATGRVITNRPTFIVQNELVGTEHAHAVPAAALLTSIGSEWVF